MIILAEDFMLSGENFSDYRLNARMLSRGTTKPTRYTPDGLFVDLAENVIYQNTGTLLNPTWTAVILGGGSFVDFVIILGD